MPGRGVTQWSVRLVIDDLDDHGWLRGLSCGCALYLETQAVIAGT